METDYEYEERAAIRQIDGGFEPEAAEDLAAEDIEGRAADRGRRDRGDYIAELQAERRNVRAAWQATDDPEEARRLKGLWEELCMKIARLKGQ